MKAFEIHTYQDGKWRIDSVFDDRELALFEARRVDAGSRYSGVRVIEENYDEASDLTTTRTIFRGGTLDRQERARKNAQEAAERKKVRRTAGSRERSNGKKARKSQQKTSHFVVPVLILGALVLAGLAALFGLQELSKLR